MKRGEWLGKLGKLERLERLEIVIRLLLSLNSLNSLNSLFSLNSLSPPYHNNRVIIKCSFRRTQFGKAQLAHTTPKKIVAIKDEKQGSRSSRNRSLLSVNEDFENKRNAAVRLYSRYYIRFSIYSTEYLPWSSIVMAIRSNCILWGRWRNVR